MSVNYGGAGYSPYYGPTGKVSFGWINESWEIFKRDAGIWIGALVIYWAILFAVQLPVQFSMQSSMQMTTSPGPPPTNPWALLHRMPIGPFAFLEVFMIVAQLFFMGSLFTMALKAVRNIPLQFSDAFSGGPLMLPMFAFGFLAFFFNLLGFLALIIGAIFTTGLLIPALPMIADREPVMSAFSKSIEAMKQDWLMAGGFVFVGWLLYFVAAMATCSFGTVVVIPMMVICMTLAYRDMVGMEGVVDRSNPYPNPYPAMQQQPPVPGTWPPAPGQSADSSQAYGQPPYYGQASPEYPGGQPSQQQPSTPPSPGWPQQPPSTQSGWPQQQPPPPGYPGSPPGSVDSSIDGPGGG